MKIKENNVNNIAIYIKQKKGFEFIGEASSLKFKRGSSKTNAILEINLTENFRE